LAGSSRGLPSPDEVAGLAVGSRLLLEAEFEAVTPLWPGGFHEARSLYLIEGGGYRIAYPTAKQIVGRARWLLRAASCSPAKHTHSKAEARAAQAFGSTEKASPFTVIVEFEGGEPYIKPESPDLQRLQHIYYTLKTTYFYTKKGEKKNYASYFHQVLEIEGFRRLQGLLGYKAPQDAFVKEDNPLEEKEQDRKGGVGEAYGLARSTNKLDKISDYTVLLWTIPRVLTAFQGKEPEDLVFNQPIRPVGLKFKVKVYRRPGAYPDENTVRDALASLLSVPVILGLGKATTRGFGRFKLVEASVAGTAEGSLGGLIGEAKRAFDSPGSFKDFAVAVADVLEAPQIEKEGVARLRCPPLGALRDDDWLKAVEDPVHPCPYATPELAKAIPVKWLGIEGRLLEEEKLVI